MQSLTHKATIVYEADDGGLVINKFQLSLKRLPKQNDFVYNLEEMFIT